MRSLDSKLDQNCWDNQWDRIGILPTNAAIKIAWDLGFGISGGSKSVFR